MVRLLATSQYLLHGSMLHAKSSDADSFPVCETVPQFSDLPVQVFQLQKQHLLFHATVFYRQEFTVYCFSLYSAQLVNKLT